MYVNVNKTKCMCKGTRHELIVANINSVKVIMNDLKFDISEVLLIKVYNSFLRLLNDVLSTVPRKICL